MASISYVRRITNNVAEYQGLLTGLRYAAAHSLMGLQVVGDSNLILGQLSAWRLPRARHLQGYYAQCRLLADRLMVTTWDHHLRQFNKMADKLANLAMDSKLSIQVAAEDIQKLPSQWSPVLELLQGDVEHWVDTNPDMEDLGRPSLPMARENTRASAGTSQK
ncbi:unnamed protein product [Phytophthora fragariaefolia]|uniref:Unnamed protein product n=1 Tax=Phytophthora fragariaefolia TaxID=1490495 RepID=A0A9W7CU04_9STRA|nr:unnamed protein product [Phytophthora fragariaefolia]